MFSNSTSSSVVRAIQCSNPDIFHYFCSTFFIHSSFLLFIYLLIHLSISLTQSLRKRRQVAAWRKEAESVKWCYTDQAELCCLYWMEESSRWELVAGQIKSVILTTIRSLISFLIFISNFRFYRVLCIFDKFHLFSQMTYFRCIFHKLLNILDNVVHLDIPLNWLDLITFSASSAMNCMNYLAYTNNNINN